jgi:putative DNA primase/helicase
MNAALRIAKALRGRSQSDGYLVRCPVPGHGQGRGDRKPSLFIKDGDQQLLVTCFSGCDAHDVLDALRRRGLLEPSDRADARSTTEARPVDPEHAANPEAIELWRGAGPIADTVAAKFLAARGLTIDPPPSLRATSVLHLERYSLPAMVAAVQAPDRRVIAVQRTLIDPRGDRKAQVRIPRMTIGALGWGAIRLAAATDVLGLAEGTEKALAAMQLFDVPCWSSLGAGRMHRVWIPDHVRELQIFVDNDDAGRAAAERTAHAHRHRRVVLQFPPSAFKDWDDVTAANAKERSSAA